EVGPPALELPDDAVRVDTEHHELSDERLGALHEVRIPELQTREAEEAHSSGTPIVVVLRQRTDLPAAEVRDVTARRVHRHAVARDAVVAVLAVDEVAIERKRHLALEEPGGLQEPAFEKLALGVAEGLT